MRKVYRTINNNDYWDKRWTESGVDMSSFENMEIYPIKYTQLLVNNKKDKILEAGCGAGRLFFHYKNLGFEIEGIEYSTVAVKNILEKDKGAKVIEGSVCEMPYGDNSFDILLALGLYHNFEDEKLLNDAISESSRVLKIGGKILASVRIDNLENRLTEFIVKKQNKNKIFDKFHKLQFTKEDIKELFIKNGLFIEDIFYARNVSFLFKFDFFRKKELKRKNFDEKKARSKGFELNLMGKIIDKFLHKYFPSQFSNIIIVIAKKSR